MNTNGSLIQLGEIYGLVLGSYIVFVCLLLAKQNVDAHGMLDITSFLRSVRTMLGVTAVLVMVAFVGSLLVASGLYVGKCPTTYLWVSDQAVPCSFWQFYIRDQLQEFYTGAPAVFSPQMKRY